MLKKLLGGLAATALLAGILGLAIPSPAGAQSATAGVAVFLGDASVGAPGLCLPGLNPAPGSCLPTNPADASGSYTFSAPSDVTLPGGVTVDGVCLGVGVFAGAPKGPNCNFSISGLLAGVGPIAPSCGVSHGYNGAGPFNMTGALGSVASSTSGVGWVTSAGGTIPVIGALGGNQMVGLTQARPLQPGACVQQPALTFTVVGVAAVLPVAAQVTCTSAANPGCG